MSKSKDMMAHDYFYEGVAEGKARKRSSQRLSFRGNMAVSYSTVIGVVVPAKGYATKDVNPHYPQTGLLILSYHCMSNYTARDIGALKSASPFAAVRMPMKFGQHDFTPGDMQKLLLSSLKSLSEDLNHADSRREFVALMEERQKLISSACESWAKPLMNKRLFAKYEDIARNMGEVAAKMKEKARKVAAEKAACRREFIRKYAGRTGKDYIVLLQSLFDDQYNNVLGLNQEQRNIGRKLLGGYGQYYCWISGDEIRTNHHATVPLKEARVAMKMWAAGKDLRTVQVGRYSIVSYTGDTIQIGCHKIPRTNMLALYEAVVGKPFPGKDAK